MVLHIVDAEWLPASIETDLLRHGLALDAAQSVAHAAEDPAGHHVQVVAVVSIAVGSPGMGVVQLHPGSA